MSLKVLGKWKHWGRSMDRKFDTIQTELQHTHKFVEPAPTSPKAPPQHPNIAKVMRADVPSPSDSETDTDDDENERDGAVYDDSKPIRFSERELDVLRRVMRKWWRLARLPGTPKLCDELGEKEFQVNWTKAVAPRLEGRIKDITPTA